MGRSEHHAVSDPTGSWDVERNGAEKANVHANIKQEAINGACTISGNQQTELVIHGKDGKTSNSDFHVNDPYPSRDWR